MTSSTVRTQPDAAASPQQQGPGRVLVTGGSSGLGAAVVAAVEAAGGTPVVLDFAPTENTSSRTYQVDVTDSVSVEQAISAAAAELGGLDAVVTAAGIDRCGALDDVPATEWDRVIAVNLLGTVNVVRAALPHLFASHGRVVTVASTLALRGVSDATAYCASKFGILGFSRALTAETAGRIGVTTLIPGGWTLTSSMTGPSSTARLTPRGSTIRRPWPAASSSPSRNPPVARCANCWSPRNWRTRGRDGRPRGRTLSLGRDPRRPSPRAGPGRPRRRPGDGPRR
ncbi:SDR family oxidoreductase [Raineyella fluvialis]|uniref:SDR family oxidoreductase n=1 Tax=Raineyella fluvialis TaxID=2662261 RepID=UPI001E478CFD|nr:SDR family oxidoreductase [Raineyella fluvialis]